MTRRTIGCKAAWTNNRLTDMQSSNGREGKEIGRERADYGFLFSYFNHFHNKHWNERTRWMETNINK